MHIKQRGVCYVGGWFLSITVSMVAMLLIKTILAALSPQMRSIGIIQPCGQHQKFKTEDAPNSKSKSNNLHVNSTLEKHSVHFGLRQNVMQRKTPNQLT
ncbi:hypothetical protein Bca4012_033586 [Brassica carinata]